MASVEQELDDFNRFARERLQAGEPKPTIDELFDEWRFGNPASEDLLAIRASIRDMEQGVRGQDYQEFAAEFRRRNGIVDE